MKKIDTSVIRTVIENRNVIAEVTPCEKVLGDLGRVYILADFWDKNADLMSIIQANELLEFATIGNFTSDEFAAFRAGLHKVGMFMAQCSKERIKLQEKV
jgi:hypothetical protein